jgi:hypothetical protein
MQDLIWDAVPTQRKKKEELFSTPVMSMSAIEKVGAGRKFSFNKAAQELLEIEGENRISFGFTPDGAHIFVRKETSEERGFKLTQTCTISDKKTYEFVAKRLNLNTDAENHFDLISLEGFCELVLKANTETATEEVIEFAKTNVGEVTDVEDMSADLSSLPEVPEGGATYDAESVEDSAEEEWESVNEEAPASEETTSEGEEEVW